MTKRFAQPFVAAITLSLSMGISVANATLAPSPVHSQTLMDVVTALQQGHYNQVEINDSLSSAVLDQYLETLDPERSYFYASDIAEFEAFRHQLDNDILDGKTAAAFTIFNRYHQRLGERIDYILTQLDHAEWDFSRDESLSRDRSEAPWPANQAEMNELWRKRLKSAVLSLKLADKSIDEARDILRKRYQNQKQRMEQAKGDDVFESFVNALTHEFDPHTQYFSPQGSENFEINMSLSLEGIGAVLQAENDQTKVVRLVPAGPADKGGQLQPADIIVGVGQGAEGAIEDVVGMRLDDVVSKIRGPKGTIVRLEIIPADAADRQKRKVISIERNKVKLEEQAARKRVLELTRDGKPYRLGVIEVPTFYIDFTALQSGDPNYKSTTRDVERLINELRSENIDGLVMDLRNNGGGSLREANELIGLFIQRGPTVQIRDASGRVDILGDFDPKVIWDGPLAVIVNRLSASASEIFAGAIQDYNRGIIVGNRTFGKGTVQTLQPIDHGQVKLTHAKFYRISGDSTQHRGVEPDIHFPSLYTIEEIGESALDKALPWDQVRPVRHGRFPSLSPFMQQLIERHQQRTEADPDFVFMRKQVAHLAEQKDSSVLTLNEAKLRAEQERNEAWMLQAENERRIGLGLPPVSQLSEADDDLPKDEQGRPINPEAEAILAESGQILIDLIDLSISHTAAAQPIGRSPLPVE
ncbi:carboxy terminal-processing peptidase [Marinobacterium sediminicola]|uniref:Carboxyl-terminal processing protease n=1 Tax=Marinobacterium sediminicola TaxID=518898 RepID=A0ABY1S338_9GAMM|nr:carboxy terminal-processing peptidase [Marinobacterium sediminicola]ULG68158.1 carboxy terminal-processing peptidase [Marinobacterium sediminicola]SMR77684.1 carboxyl-terminal processing protease [Marinobacterium sediminicola]